MVCGFQIRYSTLWNAGSLTARLTAACKTFLHHFPNDTVPDSSALRAYDRSECSCDTDTDTDPDTSNNSSSEDNGLGTAHTSVMSRLISDEAEIMEEGEIDEVRLQYYILF